MYYWTIASRSVKIFDQGKNAYVGDADLIGRMVLQTLTEDDIDSNIIDPIDAAAGAGEISFLPKHLVMLLRLECALEVAERLGEIERAAYLQQRVMTEIARINRNHSDIMEQLETMTTGKIDG